MFYKQEGKKNCQTNGNYVMGKKMMEEKFCFLLWQCITSAGEGSLYFLVKRILQYIYFRVSVV